MYTLIYIINHSYFKSYKMIVYIFSNTTLIFYMTIALKCLTKKNHSNNNYKNEVKNGDV